MFVYVTNEFVHAFIHSLTSDVIPEIDLVIILIAISHGNQTHVTPVRINWRERERKKERKTEREAKRQRDRKKGEKEIIKFNNKINHLPFFLFSSHLSLAYSTVSSIDSNNKKYPIHSDISTSMVSTGSFTDSTSPLINVILSWAPFSLAISTALYMIADWSMAIT